MKTLFPKPVKIERPRPAVIRHCKRHLTHCK